MEEYYDCSNHLISVSFACLTARSITNQLNGPDWWCVMFKYKKCNLVYWIVSPLSYLCTQLYKMVSGISLTCTLIAGCVFYFFLFLSFFRHSLIHKNIETLMKALGLDETLFIYLFIIFLITSWRNSVAGHLTCTTIICWTASYFTCLEHTSVMQ